jgi:hypothetical protein
MLDPFILFRVIALALLSSCGGLAQGVTLNLSSASGTPGTTVSLNITLFSSGTQPAAVHWTLNYSSVDFISATVSAGAAATAASKQITCNNSTGSSTCVLWGVNSNTISNGVVATVALPISAATLNTSSSVQLVDGAAAALDSTALTTSTSGNTVMILQPVATWSISGTISPTAGGSGAVVTLSGTARATATADASGNYTFTGLANGAYTVTPGKSGYTFSPFSQPVSLSGANVSAINFTANASGSTSALSVNNKNLGFGWNGTLITSPQTVTVNFSPAAAVAWTATSNQSNIVVTPPSGVGGGALQISISPGTSGMVTVTAAGATNSPQQIQVYISNVTPGLPFGSFDTPTNNTSGIAGAIPVTGWALDNIEIISVGIWREPVGGEPTNPTNGLVWIGNATFVPGARPDVQTTFPNSPGSYRGGWGYMLLTNFLPSGNGTFNLHAIATNKAGQTLDLGTRTITVDNAHASKPFGTIDTPSQGGTVSGNAYVNFGWALTQNPYVIPVDASTLTVYVDGVPKGHPTYNQYRSDIATLFPGLANSNGAVGFFYIDTTMLANGVHTIAWSVYDNAYRGDGIGSRYFNVLNSGAGGTAAPQETGPVVRVDGADPAPQLNQPLAPLVVDNDGTVSMDVDELTRIELPLGAMSGYLLVAGQRTTLPIGSTLQNGVFYWQLGPGFLGAYSMVFERADGTELRVRVRVQPKTSIINQSK